MKTPILAMFLALGAAAWADGPPPLPQSYGAAPQAAARSAASPLTRSAYPAYGAARPAARPTPAPWTGPIQHVGNFSPYWSTALRVGAGLPLGNMNNQNTVGFAGQADVLYQTTPDTALDLFATFTDMPSVGLPADTALVYYQGTAEPTTVMGLGLKGLWQFYDMADARLFLDGGLGYVALNRTQETAATGVPFPSDTTWTAGGGPAINGLLLTVGLGVNYELIPRLKLVGELDFNEVDLSGGTGDTPQYCQPLVGLQYDFQ